MLPDGQFAEPMGYPQAVPPGGPVAAREPGFWHRPKSLKIMVVAGLVTGIVVGIATASREPEGAAPVAVAGGDAPAATTPPGTPAAANAAPPAATPPATTPPDTPVAANATPPAATPPAATPRAAEPDLTPPPRPVSKQTLVLTIDAEPKSATVRINGNPVSDARFSAEVQAGASARLLIEASAAGYAPYKRTLLLDRDRTITLKLSKQQPKRTKPTRPNSGPGSLIDL